MNQKMTVLHIVKAVKFLRLWRRAVRNRKNKLKIDRFRLKTSSLRYLCFSESLSCVCCGLKGEFFSIEYATNGNTTKPHANLYAINQYGHQTLMTIDHIIPQSKGGGNIPSNLITMCTNCNMNKGDSLPSKHLLNQIKKMKEQDHV